MAAAGLAQHERARQGARGAAAPAAPHASLPPELQKQRTNALREKRQLDVLPKQGGVLPPSSANGKKCGSKALQQLLPAMSAGASQPSAAGNAAATPPSVEAATLNAAAGDLTAAGPATPADSGQGLQVSLSEEQLAGTGSCNPKHDTRDVYQRTPLQQPSRHPD